jgi:hypothetical protein
MGDDGRIQVRREEGRLIVRRAPDGLVSLSGCGMIVAGAWVALALLGVARAAGDALLYLLPAFMGALGVIFILSCVGLARRAWRLEATVGEVILVREGLFGERRCRWPAWDVASFWVEQKPGVEPDGWTLFVGFGNGRREVLVEDVSEGRLRSIAGILMGERPRPVIPRETLVAPAAPDVPEVSTSLPSSVDLRRHSRGFSIRLRPRGGMGLRVVLPALAALSLLLAVVSVLPAAPRWLVTAIGAIVLASAGVVRGRELTSSGSVDLDGEAVDVPGGGRWRMSDIDHVQTFADDGTYELQVLLKDRSKARLLKGRPGGELEWLARFLRVALRSARGTAVEALQVVAQQGICQVCGEGMTSRVVTCARCRTPHHAECWAYVGLCSTFGCREIRSLS